jgi:putative nucleotidyltransferase with HDIG domain
VEKHSAPAPPARAEELVVRSRNRRRTRPERRELWVAATLAVSFTGAAAAAALLIPHGPLSPWRFLLLAAAYTLVSRVRFEVGAGFTAPTELVFVPMLFLLPAGAVAPCVAAGLMTSKAIDAAHGSTSPARAALVLGSCWHALGPALVLGLLAPGEEPAWRRAPVYALAFAAQVGFDLGSSAVPDRVALGIRLREALGFLSWIYVTDLALAPLGLLAAFAAHGRAWVPLLQLPLVALLAHFARERRERIDHAAQLQHAYRGTALLFGELVEADDPYTAHHSRSVVELSLAVAERLRLGEQDRTLVEFAALLHDVGKVRIPAEIIRKPGALTPEERAVIETHTVLGAEMLSRVGGLLAEVGTIVRSCHERFDGGGYPDGLAGEAIPLPARIVCVCDAFDAMTTDRPYRRALGREEALAELRRCTPGQFDPRVVAALLEVVGVRRDGSLGTLLAA